MFGQEGILLVGIFRAEEIFCSHWFLHSQMHLLGVVRMWFFSRQQVQEHEECTEYVTGKLVWDSVRA